MQLTLGSTVTGSEAFSYLVSEGRSKAILRSPPFLLEVGKTIIQLFRMSIFEVRCGYQVVVIVSEDANRHNKIGVTGGTWREQATTAQPMAQRDQPA